MEALADPVDVDRLDVVGVQDEIVHPDAPSTASGSMPYGTSATTLRPMFSSIGSTSDSGRAAPLL